MGWLKLNSDAAIFGEQGCGLGCVIRDHEGSVRRAAVSQVKQMWTVEVTEAKAIALGLQFASQCLERKIVVEYDNLSRSLMMDI